MSKNMTRKGLAISAAASLALVGISGLPAQADGLADKSFVELETTFGKEYSVLAGDGRTFSLTANEASTVTGGTVKFLVEDAEKKIVPTETSTGGDSTELTDNASAIVEAGTDLVVLALPASSVADGTYLFHSEEALKVDKDTDNSSEVTVAAENELKFAVVEGDKLIFTSDNDITSAMDIAVDAIDGTPILNFVKVASSSVEQTDDTVASGASEVTVDNSANTVTITTSGVADGTYVVHSDVDLKVVGDETDTTGVNAVTALGASSPTIVDVSSNSFTLTNVTTTDADKVDAEAVLTFISPPSAGARASDGSYVVDSGQNAATSEETLVLQDTTSDTVAVDVTAWVDSNGNSEIDSTEYTSETQTVTFIKASEVDVTTSIVYPTPGDTTVTATLSMTPLLNEDQNMTAGDVQVAFSRPGATGKVDANATQNNTTRVWSATQSLETGNWAGMPHISQLVSVADGGSSEMDLTVDAGSFAVGDFVLVDGTKNALNDVTTAADIDGASGQVIALADANFPNSEAEEAAETGYVRVVSRDLSHITVTSTVKTIETDADHGLSIGDIVTVDAVDNDADATRGVVASVPTAKSFTIEGTGFTATERATDEGQVTYVSFTEAVAGTYSAQAKVGGALEGNVSTNTTVSATADDTSIATTATANVQGVSNDEVTNTPVAFVRKDETDVELTVTVVDKNDVAVTAGRPVEITLAAPDAGGTRTGTFSINGTPYTSAVTLQTDAEGKVTFTVSDDDGAAGTQVGVTVAPENLSSDQAADIDLIWADVVYSILDLNDNSAVASTGNNTVVAGGTYSYSLAVLDQWKSSPVDGTHRVKYETTNRTVETGYLSLTSGRATYNVTDAAITGQTTIQTVFTLEELQSNGTWNADEELLNDGDSNGGTDNLTYTTSVVAATQVDAVLLDTDGSTAYGNATADLSDSATTKQLVEQDRRTTNSVRPSYGTGGASEVVVSGRVSNSVSNAPRAGAEVTISGPSNILFGAEAVDSFGSLTIKADANGEFAVSLFSNTAQADTEITVTSGADSETVDVTFTGQGASFGTNLVIDAPIAAAPGSTFKVTATLTDKLGNPITTAGGNPENDQIKITYDGPGLIVGALPNDTDSKGQVSFSVLLGSNDSGSASVIVAYDQNNDGDFKDAKDLTTIKTITIGDAPVTQKVNAGSFKGYVAVYALGYEGQRLSAKIGNDWVIVDPIVNNQSANLARVTDFTGAGVDISVRIYIDRVLTATIPLTTK